LENKTNNGNQSITVWIFLGFGKIVDVRQFDSGQSNPTFYLRESNGQEYVLRKKPPGKLLPSAVCVVMETLTIPQTLQFQTTHNSTVCFV
jgi:hypothetical protein